MYWSWRKPTFTIYSIHNNMLTINIFFFFIFFSLVWHVSTAQTPPGGESGLNKSVGMSFAIIPIMIAGGFFLSGIVFVTFRRQLGTCLFGINVNVGNFIGGRRAPVGLSQEVIESFPTFLYEDVKVHRRVEDELECAICLNQFQDHEILRLMPECNHIFHPECIDPWLHSQATCPVCRKTLDPSSSTPTTPPPPSTNTQQQIDGSEDSSHHAITVGPISPLKSPAHQCPDHVEPESTIDEPKRGDLYTLKLPEEARLKLESSMWRFGKASNGNNNQYRSKTPESGRIELNQLWCEPERGGLNRTWRCFVSQPASPYSSSGDGETSPA